MSLQAPRGVRATTGPTGVSRDVPVPLLNSPAGYRAWWGVKTGSARSGSQSPAAVRVVLVTDDPGGVAAVLPALDLLDVQVDLRTPSELTTERQPDGRVTLVDGRREPARSSLLCGRLRSTGSTPIVLVAHEATAAAISAPPDFDSMIMATAGPAEVTVRLRMLAAPRTGPPASQPLRVGRLVMDDSRHSVLLGDLAVDLTCTEFKLLRRLVEHRGQVVSRAQLGASV